MPCRVRAYRLALPLRRPFPHAAAVRHISEVVVVELEAPDGTRGIGEGVPREYVTGETVDAAWAALPALATEVIRRGREALPAPGSPTPTPALRCALDLALRDLEARSQGARPWESLPAGPDRQAGGVVWARGVRYSGVIGSELAGKAGRKAALYRLAGLPSLKVKVGPDAELDRERILAVRRRGGRRTPLRVDANGVWKETEAVRRLAGLADLGLQAVEEPVRPGDVEGACRVSVASGLPVVLDESAVNLKDLEAVVAARSRHGGQVVINLRLSKHGGMDGAWAMAQEARRQGLGLALGCQVGETGILSAAGRGFAVRCAADILWAEGSFDRFLLRRVPTVPDVTFGCCGRGTLPRGPGLGVDLRRPVREELVADRMVLP